MTSIEQHVLPANNPWWPTIRRAFEIPDHVYVANAQQAIARAMLNVLPPVLPPPDQPGAALANWKVALELAEKHLTSFLDAAGAGDLDLPLCGHGQITDSVNWQDPPRQDGPATSAVEAMKQHLGEDAPCREDWLMWLWSTFHEYVTDHPYS